MKKIMFLLTSIFTLTAQSSEIEPESKKDMLIKQLTNENTALSNLILKAKFKRTELSNTDMQILKN